MRVSHELLHPRITAQIANGDEAYVALRRSRDELGRNGEATIAEVWHTSDRGRSWHPLPWRRAARALVSRAVFASWPPEWVNRMWLRGTHLEIEVFDDQGIMSWRAPIWRATWDGARWQVRFDRVHRPEVDGAIVPPSLVLDLPGITTPPAFGPFH